jgi:hypothetical protein
LWLYCVCAEFVQFVCADERTDLTDGAVQLYGTAAPQQVRR